jgi:hypothetical protein
MKLKSPVAALAALTVFLGAPSIVEAKRNIADYTLHLHIYSTNWSHNSFGYHGFGRANLFDEKSVPHGVEFTYDCEDHLMASDGNEAYPAKWKKPGQSMEVIFGEIGQKPDEFHACEFKVAEKPYVFYRNAQGLQTESAQEFLDYAAKHNNNGIPSTDVPVSATPHKGF